MHWGFVLLFGGFFWLGLFLCVCVCGGVLLVVFFFKVYKGNLSMWNWKNLLNPELFQEVHAEFLVLRTMSLVWHFYFSVVLLYF